jgi:hypothetical protein
VYPPDVDGRDTPGHDGEKGEAIEIKRKRSVNPVAGFWGERFSQADPAVDAFELQINPNNESYYLPHPNGGYVQFEKLIGTTLQDGKLVTSPNSLYYVEDVPEFLQQKVLAEAKRQIEAAKANNLSVEWLVSDERAVAQIDTLLRSQPTPLPIKVIYFPAGEP